MEPRIKGRHGPWLSKAVLFLRRVGASVVSTEKSAAIPFPQSCPYRNTASGLLGKMPLVDRTM